MKKSSDKKLTWLLASLSIVAIFEILSLSGFSLPKIIAIPLFSIVILAIGYHTLYEGLKAAIHFDFKNINLLMLIAVVGAFFLEKYVESAIVIVLYNLAERLEDLGIQQSKGALSELAQKMPKTALLKGHDDEISINQVKINDEVIVKPGEMIPLDGIVLSGFSAIDESPITGEPIPKDKMQGDLVFAGTLNKQGYLEIKVTKLSQNTTLAKIEEITFQATQSKAHTQKFIEAFSKYYTPSIIILAIVWMIVSFYVFEMPFKQIFLQSLTLLVIACPCALVISTPVSIFSAIGNASRRGILIKGGRYLEAIGKIKAIALDKTRTLTYGEPIVTDVIPFGNHTKEQVLSCAAGIENHSEHPLAQSVVDAASKESYMLHQIENFQIKVGKGVQADCLVCEDKHHCIGKLQFILEEHDVPSEVVQKIDSLQNEGKTVLIICTHKEVEGVIALVDKIRSDSSLFIEDLKRLQIVPVMLTGDNQVAAKFVAHSIGIAHVEANLLPDEKAAAIQRLLSEYRAVAMFGDGINDAPSLALSSVGITISKLGSDTAIEAASIVILNDQLNCIPFLIKLGRRAIIIIRSNVALSIIVKFVFIALALNGWSNLALAIFADVGVTIMVILNGLRLRRQA